MRIKKEKKSLLEQYQDYQRSRTKKEAEETEGRRAKEDKQTKAILELLSAWGIKRVNTNGYWFHFTFNEIYFDLVNQSVRVCGYKHRFVTDQTEIEMLNHLHQLEFQNYNLYKEICLEYNYEHYCLDGRPDKMVEKLLRETA